MGTQQWFVIVYGDVVGQVMGHPSL